jgi:hypothetical protein
MPQNASPAYSSAAIEVLTPTETVVIALDALPSPHPIFVKKAMKPPIVLLIIGLLSAGIARLTTGDWRLILAANIGMCAMLLFTALGHFMFTNGMVAMIPRPDNPPLLRSSSCFVLCCPQTSTRQ